MSKSKHSPGPWKIDGQFDDGVDVGILDADGNEILGVQPMDGVNLDEWGERSQANAYLIAAAPELLEVARIEQALHMHGFTKATAIKLGPEARDSYLSAGVPGLNDWRRRKRESAIAKAEPKHAQRPGTPGQGETETPSEEPK